MKHLIQAVAAAAVAFVVIFMLLGITYSSETKSAPLLPAGDTAVYLPIVFQPISPAGAYDCYEYEYGLIWTSEAITLSANGSSVYKYNPPYEAIVTGTWVYTPNIKEVGFTNFRWPTATFQTPNRLWASMYLTYAGFEIALSCGKPQ